MRDEPSLEPGSDRRSTTLSAAHAQDAPPEVREQMSDFAFLAEASRLLADSLDYETTLATVARLALPHLGGWCIVDLLESDGSMRRLAIIHPDERKQALARKLESGWPPEADDPLGVPLAIRRRSSELISHVPDEMLVEVAKNEENLRILRELGIGSVLVVPLQAYGRVIGAVTFLADSSEHRFTQHDLELAEDLAARSAIAVENARLLREAEEARTAAQSANQAKSIFLATMSHEIRTPINAIVGYVDLIQMELAGPITEEQREKLERVEASSKHLLRLVNEVLDLAKVESGQMTVERHRTAVRDVVMPALGMISTRADEKGITVENEVGDDPALHFVGDEDRVRQILVNLLTNAVKFTPEEGTVRITAGAERTPSRESGILHGGHWVHIDVEDTGIGIAPENLGAVFAPFTQTDAGSTRTEGGTGLGLTISRQLARLMGGDLTVRSTPNEGSRFTLWLPTEGGEADTIESSAQNGEGNGLGMLGSWLVRSAGAVADRMVARLREDPGIRGAAEGSDVSLKDHSATLLSDVGQSMIVLAEPGEDPAEILRDGTRIQQLISELHGAQRYRMGWSESALGREFELLGEEIRHAFAEEAKPDSSDESLKRAQKSLGRFLERAERVSRRSYQLAAAADAM